MSKQKQKILGVENDLSQQMIFDATLCEMNLPFVMEWTEDGERALRKLHCPYALVIADIFLDGNVTGIDLWNICRHHFPLMPFVVISSLPFDKFLDFEQANASRLEYFQKPLEVAVIRQIFHKLAGEGSLP